MSQPASGIVLAAAALLLVLGLSPPTAGADPWWGGGGCAPVRGGSCASPVVHGRRGGCDVVHVNRFVARGQSWSLMRRYLHRIRIDPTHGHPRSYFYRRWPARYGEGWRGATCIGHDFPTTECPLVMAALGDEDIPRTLRDPTPTERLGRGMERFFRGAYEDAREDFLAARDADPKDVRPVYGLLFCDALGTRDWASAVNRMRGLAAQGALDARDRLDLEGTFADPKTFTRWRDGLTAFTRYDFHEVDAQVVAGWSYALTGDEAKARAHWRSALRFDKENAVARHLLSTLEAPKSEAEDPPAAERDLLPRDPPENLARRSAP